MFKSRLFQILFSLTVIAALALAAVPAPVYALSAPATNLVSSGGSAIQNSSVVLPPNILVCRVVIIRHAGHLIIFRLCHRVEKPI